VVDDERFPYHTQDTAVQFGSGVKVLSLRLASDSSAVHIENLPVDITPQKLSELLSSSDYPLPKNSIVIRTLPNATATADVQHDEPNFTDRMVKSYDTAVFAERVLKVRPAHVTERKGSSLNIRQVSTLVCSWYKPSRVAWAHYDRLEEAKKTQKMMDGKWIDGRKVQCTCQEPTFHSRSDMVYSVQIGNLPRITSSSYLKQRFRSAENIVMGKLSYESSTLETAEMVRAMLQEAGNLESFDVNTLSNARFQKAFARFSSAQEARTAVQKFNGHKLPKIKVKLFLTLLVSVKFKLLRDLFRAVEGELNDLRIQVLAEEYITFKTYQSEDRPNILTLRVYGEDTKSVAKAKSSIEVILAGTSARKDDRILWDEFFLKPEGLTYLKHIQELHGGFIYRDSRKHQLSLYGSPNSKRQLLDTLVKKTKSLAEQSHKIILTPTMLKRVFQGGLQEVCLSLGEGKARLHITSTEKTIKIDGSKEDVQTAKRILENPSGVFTQSKQPSADSEAECSVCWTEPDDIYRTSCGHTYCKECFAGFCASATSAEHFPLKCLGDATRCIHVFGMTELQRALAPTAFDDLLKSSLETYIRTRPGEFQYCVTADCPQVYRITKNGRVFDCPSCLTPICTTCQAVSHNGSTCEEYKDLSSEGTMALKKWMEENKGKACPKCETPIQKSYGCNHMTCPVCSTHFCWFCMEVFGSHDIYEHMTAKHGNIGIDIPDNLEDENVERFRLLRM
jgi:IBR domain, a half RING-finger domain